MEGGFGVDFSQVWVYMGSQVVYMSVSIGVCVFIYGNDIYFNEGEY